MNTAARDPIATLEGGYVPVFRCCAVPILPGVRRTRFSVGTGAQFNRLRTLEPEGYWLQVAALHLATGFTSGVAFHAFAFNETFTCKIDLDTFDVCSR